MSKFEGSMEATEHMMEIEEMLQDERLTEWVEATDANFGTDAVRKLAIARAALTDFLETMDAAG